MTTCKRNIHMINRQIDRYREMFLLSVYAAAIVTPQNTKGSEVKSAGAFMSF